MQFRDLHKQYLSLQPNMNQAIKGILDSGVFIGGSHVKELERGLADYVNAKHCISCANGTDALQLALMAWEVGAGDAVIVPDFTFFSSGEVVSSVGATPIFIDVDRSTFNLQAGQIEEAWKLAKANGLTPKALVAVDLFGLPANYDAIKKHCKDLDLLLLEDGAQGFGGAIGNERACSFGDISTTSFFPAKPLGCYGDGGAIFTDDDDWAALLRSYAVHGKGTMKYDNVRVGMNSRLDALQAAILQIKLDAFANHELTDVNTAADVYASLLENLASQYMIKLPDIPTGYTSAWAQYTIQLPLDINRNALQAELKELGIPTMIYYPKPMHLQKAFEGKSLRVSNLTVTESLCKCVLSLPVGPYITEDEIQQVVDGLKQALPNCKQTCSS